MKDLRKDFDYASKSFKMSKGHEKKFEQRLHKEFGSSSKKNFSKFYKYAAVALIAVLSTILMINQTYIVSENSAQNPSQESTMRLGDVSADLKTIENYYLTSIKLELATLETPQDHEAMVNSYLEELKIINDAYKELGQDLNEYGVTEEIVNAMIDNLQLRLELLQNLKQKLNHLNKKQNENNLVYQI
ncbi:hypothetical protein [Psychroflexus tropicus]|uniref:hypothetical protein n=1 Tax=Psychroflexus tropicus TaxID=197345 RepID=UPI00037D3172|nr:hypothetical protein [Psychroflexus tropicus]